MHKIAESNLFIVENILECVTIIVNHKEPKRFIVTFMYQTPGSQIHTFYS